jgi:hypothetical protein
MAGSSPAMTNCAREGLGEAGRECSAFTVPSGAGLKWRLRRNDRVQLSGLHIFAVKSA